jgi:sialate O-acetylesterase
MFLIVAYLLLPLASSATAEVKLPAVISDNMVLQRDMQVPIWGKANPQEKVTVTIGRQSVSANADDQGNWTVKLKPLKPGGPIQMTVAGKNTITLNNILIGDVWLCSGQSNMNWRVKNSANPEQEIAAANYPKIRLFAVTIEGAVKPKDDVQGQWDICNPETVAGFSAVAYYFGRQMHKTLDVPIGLIRSAVGGTPAEAWTSMPTLKADPTFKPILERWEQELALYPQRIKKYAEKLPQWKEAAKKAKAEGKPVPRPPREPRGPGHRSSPAALYNAMIAPLVPYAIKGAIWYQGEANAGRAYEYRKLFPAMINNWRSAWDQGDFPFLFVQLANFKQRHPQPTQSAWAELREAQLMTLKLPNTGMAVTIDIGDADDIHPKNKQDVGRRLALAAQTIAHKRQVVYSGPINTSMTVEANKIRLQFKHVNGGLIAKGGELTGFAIAGADRKFVWAKAKIEGSSVVVWNESIARPVAVRYAWADNPARNLYNQAGLPGSPFRTDNWPGITAGK